MSGVPVLAGGQLPSGGQQASAAQAGHAALPAQQVCCASCRGRMYTCLSLRSIQGSAAQWDNAAMRQAHKPVQQLCRFHQQRRDQQQREEMTKHQDRQPRKQQQKRPQFFHRNDQRVRPSCSPTHPCILSCPRLLSSASRPALCINI